MNIIDHIEKYRDDFHFKPTGDKPTPTTIRPGPDKVEVMAARVLAGQELWADGDPTCFAPITEATLVKELYSLGDMLELSHRHSKRSDEQ